METQAFRYALCAIAALASVIAPPALAESRNLTENLSELDSLSRESANIGTGLALARKKMDGGDLVGALATVELVLTNHPESDDAMLLHASLLCRLDDRSGSMIDFDELHGRDFPAQVWADATAPCAAARKDANRKAVP